jgi:hypothetical protein
MNGNRHLNTPDLTLRAAIWRLVRVCYNVDLIIAEAKKEVFMRACRYRPPVHASRATRGTEDLRFDLVCDRLWFLGGIVTGLASAMWSFSTTA